MRKLSFVLAGFVLLSATPSFAWMPGDNPYDPGCNVNQGGNCGRQLDSWNHTWRRMGLPQERGRGAYGTYLPGGGFVPDGFGGYGAGYGGAYGGGYGGGYGAGYGGMYGGGYGGHVITVTRWHRHEDRHAAVSAAASVRAQRMTSTTVSTVSASDVHFLRSIYQ